MKVLFLSHTESDGSLGKAACEALGAAKGLGGDLTVGLYGAEVEKAANQIAGCGAAGRISSISGMVAMVNHISIRNTSI